MENLAEAPRAAVMSDPSAKRARTFQCKDALWNDLERIADELECTVDYLLNEAVKHYIRQRLTRDQRPIPPSSLLPAVPAPSAAAPPPQPFASLLFTPPVRLPMPVAPPPLPVVPPPLPIAPPPQPFARPVPPAPPPMRPPARPPLPPPPPLVYAAPPAGYAAPPLPPPPGYAAPAPILAPPPPPPTPRSAPAAKLAVTYGDRTVFVDQPGFVIGRGKQGGLTIKDPNISRRHAIVEMQGGRYYLVDMGSTNGTKVNGQMISRKEIAEGDVAEIVNHQIRFSFRSGT